MHGSTENSTYPRGHNSDLCAAAHTDRLWTCATFMPIRGSYLYLRRESALYTTHIVDRTICYMIILPYYF